MKSKAKAKKERGTRSGSLFIAINKKSQIWL